MKIRFKNNNQLLNEGTVLNNAQKPDNIAANSVQHQSDFTIMDRIATKQFIQERKRELLPIDIAVPSDFYTPIMLKPGPQDLQVVMHTVQTNKARKTRDLEAWGMVDPISTFNNAEDCCYKIFNSFFRGPIQLAQSKAEIKANKQDIKDSNESLAYESVSYNYYKPLNESAALTGLALGNIAGSLASAGVNFLGAMGAGFAVSVAPAVGAIMVSTDLIGKAGQKIFGDTDRNDRNTNDEVAAHLNAEQIAQSVTQIPLNGNGDIVAAIDNYIKEMLQAGRELFAGLSPNMAKKYTTEFENFVIGCQSELSEKLKDFIQENSKQIQEEKALRDKIRMNKLESEQLNITRRMNIVKALTTYISNGNGSSNITTAIKLSNDILNNNKNAKNIIDNWSDGDDIEVIINNYAAKTQKTPTAQHSSILYDFDMSMRLNEDNTEQTGRIDINLEDIYGVLRKDLIRRINDIADEFDPKNMVNLAETKQTMEDLIKAADETIKNKIQIITKANVSPAASKESGLGTAAIQFLAGHPIEANNLTEVWSRHLADLKTRMNNRIKIMTDANNPVRTLGWTLNMCRTIFPEFFARMLTYRYAYALLTNHGIYSYDTAQAVQDISIFNNTQDPSTGQSLRDAYVSNARAQIIYVLNNYGSEYTTSDSTFIDVDEDGGYKLNGNTIRYGSLMLHRIAGNNLTSDDKMVGGTALANLSRDNEGLEHLINIIYGNSVLHNIQLDVNNIVAIFKLTDDLKQSKEVIKNAYNTIINIICKNVNNDMNNTNIAEKLAKYIVDSLYIINGWSVTDIYNAYTSHKQEIDILIKEFKNNANYGISKKSEDSSSNSNNNELLTKIKNDIKQYFNNVDFTNIPENSENSYVEAIKTIFSTDENKVKNDYYSYILSWYSNNKVLAGTALQTMADLFSSDEISRICEMTPALLELATSGILGYVLEGETEQHNEEKKANELTTKFQLIRTFFNDINLGDKEILNNRENENKPDYQEEKEKYQEARNNVKNQLIDAYKEASKDSTYKIKALYNNDNKSLYEANTGENQEETNKDWFNELIAKGIQFDKPEDIKTAFGSIKVIDVNNANNSIKEFNKLDDKDKNIVLLNLASAIEKVNDNNAIKNLVNEILKKWGIDVKKAKEDADIEAALPSLLTKSNDYFNKVKEVKIKMESDNADENIKKEYNNYKNEVINQLSTSYKTNTKDSIYKIKALYNNDINKSLTEENQKAQESINKDNWFNGLMTCFTTFKSIDNIRTAFANVKIIVVKDNKVEKEYEFSDETINKTIQNKILFDLCNAFKTVMNDGNLPEMLATLQKQLGIDVKKAKEDADIKKDLKRLLPVVKSLFNRIYLIDNIKNTYKDSNFKNAIENLNKLKDNVKKQILANYQKIIEKNNLKYYFILNDNFYKNFEEAMIIFKNKSYDDNINAISSLNIKVKTKDGDKDFITLDKNIKYNILYNFCKTIELTNNNGDGKILKNILENILQMAKRRSKQSNTNESLLFFGKKQYSINNIIYENNIETLYEDENNSNDISSDNISSDEFNSILNNINDDDDLKQKMENIVNNIQSNDQNLNQINNLNNLLNVIQSFKL